jgi:hypothetical protein
MAYWFYENYPKKYTRLHDSDCQFCNDGKGLNLKNLPENGKWHGPFLDKTSASHSAMLITDKAHSKCQICS